MTDDALSALARDDDPPPQCKLCGAEYNRHISECPRANLTAQQERDELARETAEKCYAVMVRTPLSPDDKPLRIEWAEVIESALAQQAERIDAWRKWAQFVFRDGGQIPDGASDDDLSAAVCAAYDAEVASLRAELEQARATITALEAQRALRAEQAERALEQARTQIEALKLNLAGVVARSEQLREEGSTP